MLRFQRFSCKGCVEPKRHTGCHATCEDYIKERNEFEQLKKEIDKKRRIDGEYFTYKKSVIRKAMKRNGSIK